MQTLAEISGGTGFRSEYAKHALSVGYTEDDWIHQNEVYLKAHNETMKHSSRYHSVVKDALDLVTPVLGVLYKISYEGGISQGYDFAYSRGRCFASMKVSSTFLLDSKNQRESKSRLFSFNPGERIEITEYRHSIRVSDVTVGYDVQTLDLDDDYASDSIMFPLNSISVFEEILKCFQVK